MKAKRWYIKFPLDAYALGPVNFDKEVGEQEVREYARKLDGCVILPQGFVCWPTT